jgi:DNA replication protein DnaC
MSTEKPVPLGAILPTSESVDSRCGTLRVVAPDSPGDDVQRQRRNDALAALNRTVPQAFQWARFTAPELSDRAGPAASAALRDALWRTPRLVFVGAAGSGKTSLAVACLRRWAHENARAAAFFHACELGMARIQHPAGRGEPELVERATKWPLVLLDDLGSERGIAGCAVPDVIYLRHAAERPLWITTGLSRTAVVERYGAGVARRVFEGATIITLDA